ncbi:GNAT family N-acetyltransferase [Catellatospora tritici]|uniref:GNAT family N-acetyltransferase n=1 Tax=Catellatospora tritici TaxID=2851566 RepID=UPI001C2D4837|nr:GNAT family N-acetyltransferase [Catellatospora tritici]MBV1854991.1 GNAT family N-acetyltransferase [Catellatospora tritici]
MVSVRVATEAEQQSWREDWRERLHRHFAGYADPGARHQMVERRLGAQQRAEPGTVLVAESDGRTVGHLALGRSPNADPSEVFVFDLHAPGGEQVARSLFDHARRYAAEQGVQRLGAITPTGDPAVDALLTHYPLRAQQMVKDVSLPVVLPDGLTGRPMAAAEYGPWLAGEIRGYADDITESGSATAEAALARSQREFAELLPDGLGTAEHSLWTLCDGERAVAHIWLRHGYMAGMGYVFGVNVHEGERGKGYGRAVMLLGERETAAAGDAQLGLNVFGANTVARNLYDKLGYQVVDQFRSDDL